MSLTDAKLAARLAQSFVNSDAPRVGVVDWEVADYNPASPAAYNGGAPTWERVGTIVPGSAKPELGRSQYDIMRGMPQTATKSLIIGQEGKYSVDLDEYTSRALEIIQSGDSSTATTSGATTVSAAPAPTAQVFTVAAIGTIGAGSIIQVTTQGKTYQRKVNSVSGSAITLLDPLPVVPVSTDPVAVVTLVQTPLGGTTLKYFSSRLVFTDTNGDQMIYHFPKTSGTGDIKPGFREKEHTILAVNFKIYGVSLTIGGKSDYYLGSHYYIPGVGGTPV